MGDSADNRARDDATPGSRGGTPGIVDVLVGGGGPAGIAAALAAARQGARTLLVERYGRLGGAAVHNLVAPLMGDVRSPLADEITRHLASTGWDWEQLDLAYADMLEADGVEILLHTAVEVPVLRDARVVGARLRAKCGLWEQPARVVVDATGDGDVAFAAGAPFESGRPSDGRLQPAAVMFRLGGVDKRCALLCGSEEDAGRVVVDGVRWSEVVAAGQRDGELPPTVGVIRVYESPREGERIVNATQVNGIDGTDPRDLTRAELEGRRQARTVTDFLKRHAPGYARCHIAALPAAVGIRETRRFRARALLTRADLLAGREPPDAVVCGASFPIDIHNPAGGGQAEGFAARVRPYGIPYGCLLPEGVDGLLLAGRCIGGDHAAHASYRVQRICMAIGAAAGAAAALAARADRGPDVVAPAAIRAALGLGAPA